MLGFRRKRTNLHEKYDHPVKAATADGETRTEKAANVAEVRKDAAAEKREADYKAAAERCDALSGDLKSKCVDDAKRRFAQ